MNRRLNGLLGIAMVALWSCSALLAYGAPPIEKEAAQPPHISQQQVSHNNSQNNKGQNHGAVQSSAEGMRNPTARQGTPVLGVVIGKPLEEKAAEVVRVWPGSPAAQAGLKKGDEIVKLDGQAITSPEALRMAVLKRRPGDRINLHIAREGKEQSLKVRLGGADGQSGWARRGTFPKTSQSAGWLGVDVASQESANEPGVIVTRVFPESPADQAGIKQGDDILRVDKTRVEAPSDLQMAIREHKPDDTVRLVVKRNGQRQHLNLQLGSLAHWNSDVSQLTDREARKLAEELIDSFVASVSAANQSAAQSNGSASATVTPQKKPLRREVNLPRNGVCVLTPTKGSDVRGVIVLHQQDDGLHLTGKVSGLKPGLHGFHIHQFGDLRDPNGKSAGGHFNPRGTKHGGPNDQEHHAGDLGNIKANADGVANVDITAPWLKLHFVIGRSIVVHAGQDDLQSQPSGAAGPRAAVGVIGIAQRKRQD